MSAKTNLHFMSELYVVLFEFPVSLEHRKQRFLLRLQSTHVVDGAPQYRAFVPATTVSVHTHARTHLQVRAVLTTLAT